MRVLIIGNGGREHALAWKVVQSAQVEKVWVAPGNAGTALEAGVENIAIKPTEVEKLVSFAGKNKIDLTIVGPEAALGLGLVDAFRAANLACFGPTRLAAQLETSKAFSKDFMRKHHIPTAAYAVFTDITAAKNYLKQQKTPLVIKADGLAAGKGVIIAQTQQEALAAVTDMLAGNTFGEAGHKVIIEEFLTGEEVSFIVMVDGNYALPLASSQDHKARDNADQGPNTGGMGAYSPAPIISTELHEQIMQHIIYPTIQGMAALGHVYTGFLYAGLMITPDKKAKVLEFNCRLGDPETQPIMMRLQSDLTELCMAALNQRLRTCTINWDPRPALGVVMAASGYPLHYPQGDIIHGLDKIVAPDVKVFHAGTVLKDNQIITAGGRVLCVTALGDTIKDAQAAAYSAVHKIHWVNEYYRTDIGYKAIIKETV